MSSLLTLAYSLETTDETLHRYGSTHLQAAAFKISLDLKLFRILANINDASVEELSEKTGAESLLLGRILKYLAAIGAVEQVSGNQFKANHITQNLTEKAADTGVNHYRTGRVSLLIAEMTLVCNTFYVHKGYQNGTFGYQFGVFPGLHGGDLLHTLYQDSDSSQGVTNTTAALVIQNFDTNFAQTGHPRWIGLPSFPNYGPDAQIIDVTQTSIYRTRDTAANQRCNWWQQGIFA